LARVAAGLVLLCSHAAAVWRPYGLADGLELAAGTPVLLQRHLSKSHAVLNGTQPGAGLLLHLGASGPGAGPHLAPPTKVGPPPFDGMPRYGFFCRVEMAAMQLLFGEQALRDVQPAGNLTMSNRTTGGGPAAQPHGHRGPAGPTLLDPCMFGHTKFFWAVLLTCLSMCLMLACIPLLLTVSRRRPPGQPLFLCCAKPAPPPLTVSSRISFTY